MSRCARAGRPVRLRCGAMRRRVGDAPGRRATSCVGASARATKSLPGRAAPPQRPIFPEQTPRARDVAAAAAACARRGNEPSAAIGRAGQPRPRLREPLRASPGAVKRDRCQERRGSRAMLACAPPSRPCAACQRRHPRVLAAARKARPLRRPANPPFSAGPPALPPRRAARAAAATGTAARCASAAPRAACCAGSGAAALLARRTGAALSPHCGKTAASRVTWQKAPPDASGRTFEHSARNVRLCGQRRRHAAIAPPPASWLRSS